MIDPLDQETFELTLPAQPMTSAERQRKLREKRRLEREAGRRVELSLQAPELAVLSLAVKEFQERWEHTSKAAAAEALLPRLPLPNLAELFPADSAWLADVRQQTPGMADWPATSEYQRDVAGLAAPIQYRQTPHGQPGVDQLVRIGDTIWTSYCSGPYVVCGVKPYECYGMRVFTLELRDLGRASGAGKRSKRDPDGWINELVAVDGRILKLFANNDDEVYVARTALAGGFVELNEAEAVRAECRRIAQQSLRNYQLLMEQRPVAEPTFDDLVLKLLSHKDRTLLEWARRNEELVRETPADQAYPADPEKRNLLGKVLCEKSDLNGRYQVLLEQALELYSLVDLRRHTPKMSRPDDFVREYKRYSESHAGLVARSGSKVAANRFAAIGRPNEFAQLREQSPEDAQIDDLYAQMAARPLGADVESPELVKAKAEMESLRAELQEIAAEFSGKPAVQAKPGPDVAALQAEVARLNAKLDKQHTENLNTIADLGKALQVTQAMQDRLKEAGLPHDYRQYLG